MPVTRCLRLLSACLLLAVVLLCALVGRSVSALQFDALQLRELGHDRYGARGADGVSRWLELLDNLAGTPEATQLRAVNDFWNRRVRSAEDIDVWRRADYWATPLQTLGVGAGDCEDFVIGKYFSLVHLGVDPEKLRLIYVRANVGGRSIAHMVLGYYATPASDPLILDNLIQAIRPAAQRRDLTPVFSFNARGVYVAGTAAQGVDRISRWQGLLSRMREEGFQP